MSTRGLLLIISGPSGVGKTTISRAVESRLGGLFSVSLTTRPRTARDVDGVDYRFVDEPTFRRLQDGGHLLESAEVFGQLYGTPSGPVLEALDAGRLMILEIDVQGAIQVKATLPEALAVYILPPGEQVLLERLRARRREDEAAIQRRFNRARAEIARARESGVYDLFVVNADLDQAIDQTIAAVRARWAEPARP